MKYKIKYLPSRKKPIFILGLDKRHFLRDTFRKNIYFHHNPECRVLYFNLAILINIPFSFISLKSIKSAYLAALIKAISPELVITLIDNSIHFFRVARMLHKKIRFIAIQNGLRMDLLMRPKIWCDEIFIPEFVCFGKNEKDLYNELNADVGKFHIVGSLKEMAFREESSIFDNSSGNDTVDYKYDICVVSESFDGYDKDYPGLENACGSIVKFARKFGKEHGLKLALALKYPVDFKTNSGSTEVEFYSRFANLDSFTLGNQEGNVWSSYEMTYQSRVTLGMTSTLLLETASRGNRVLICDFFGKPWSVIGITESLANINHELSYEKFSQALTNVLKESNHEYINKRKSQFDYLMSDSGEKKVSEILSEIIAMPGLTK